MKQLVQKILVLMTVLPIGSAMSKAEDFSSGGIYYKIKSSTNNTVEVTYRGKSYDSYANEYSGSVIIPETVTYSGKTYSVTSIGGAAFYGCSGLTNITIPNSVTSIVASTALAECSSLKFIIVNEGNPVYDSRDNCNAIIETATNTLVVGCKNTNIPNSVTNIGGYAFYKCSSLTSMTIGNSVTSIGEAAFRDCSALTSVTIPNSVTNIGGYAFYKCSSLTSMTIGNSVTSIGDEAFYGCSLPSVTIPNSVTSIGDYAFGCSSLTSVTIGNSVTEIGQSAFGNYSSLKFIIVNEGNPVYDSRDNCNAIIETATNALVLGCKNTNIPNSVASIGDYAFYGFSSLTSITIPNSVTNIGESAFCHCSSLTSITIPNSVTNIGEWAFGNCSSLTSIIIPNSVTSIGQRAFAYSSSLSSVTILSSATIPYEAFYSCSSLTSVTIGNSVTNIGKSAFFGCSSLTSVTLPAGVTSIGGNAFSGCSALEKLYIGSSVTSIGDNLLTGCPNLNTLSVGAKIPPTVNDLGLGGQQYFTVKLQVPEGSKAMYQFAEGWKKFFNIEEFDPTGIANFTPDAEEKNLPIYNLQGARMTEDKENLPTGIYIQGGKKIFIK